MKILFLLGDYAEKSIERQLAKVTAELIGKDARVVWYDPARRLSSYGRPSGVWIFTHEEEGGCPGELLNLLSGARRFLDDIPVTFSGIGGKDGAMNALTEIQELLEGMEARIYDEGELISIPLRGSRLDLDRDERMDLFWQVDEFLKYCGMDDSESRKIAFERVIENCFSILKYLLPEEKPKRITLNYPVFATEDDRFDCDELSEQFPDEIKELYFELDALKDDYEIEDEELLPALLDKIAREW